MKKTITAICTMLLILHNTLVADDKAITMQTMLEGVNMIQLGLLTNTQTIVEQGVLEIKYGKKSLEAIDRSHYLSFDEIQAQVYTMKITKKLDTHTKKLLKHYKEGDIGAAMTEYHIIMQQCVECHAKLRDFVDRADKLP